MAHGWALCTGLVFSLLTPLLVLSRDARVVVLFTAVYYSFALAIMVLMGDGGDWLEIARYGLYSGALPFVVGLYVYLLRGACCLPVPGLMAAGLFTVLVALVAFQREIGLEPYVAGFWCVQLVVLLLVISLSKIDVLRFPYWLQAMERFFGGVAYPFVLSVIPVGAFIAWKCPEMYTTDENQLLHYHKPWELMQYTLPAAFIVGCVVYGVVEMPVAQLRARMRAKVGALVSPKA
jgi:peptidoglycan/LPS O-acetylase OafA/YrhL